MDLSRLLESTPSEQPPHESHRNEGTELLENAPAESLLTKMVEDAGMRQEEWKRSPITIGEVYGCAITEQYDRILKTALTLIVCVIV